MGYYRFDFHGTPLVVDDEGGAVSPQQAYQKAQAAYAQLSTQGAPPSSLQATNFAIPSGPPETAYPTTPPTIGDRASNIGASFIRGLGHGVADNPEAIALGARVLQKGTGINFGQPEKLEDFATWKAAEFLDAITEEVAGEPDARFADSWVYNKIPQALGNVASFLGGTGAAKLLTKGIGKAAPMVLAKELAEQAAQKAAAEAASREVIQAAPTLAGRLGQHVLLEAPTIAPLSQMSVGSLGVGGFEDAMATPGTTEEQGLKSFLANAPIGLTELVPLSGQVGRFMNRTKVPAIGRKVLSEGFEEGVVEGGQTLYGNKVAQESYDPTRKLSKGVGESAGVGGTAGGLTTLLLNAMVPGKQLAGRPPALTGQQVTPEEQARQQQLAAARAKQLSNPEETMKMARITDDQLRAMATSGLGSAQELVRHRQAAQAQVVQSLEDGSVITLKQGKDTARIIYFDPATPAEELAKGRVLDKLTGQLIPVGTKLKHPSTRIFSASQWEQAQNQGGIPVPGGQPIRGPIKVVGANDPAWLTFLNDLRSKRPEAVGAAEKLRNAVNMGNALSVKQQEVWASIRAQLDLAARGEPLTITASPTVSRQTKVADVAAMATAPAVTPPAATTPTAPAAAVAASPVTPAAPVATVTSSEVASPTTTETEPEVGKKLLPPFLQQPRRKKGSSKKAPKVKKERATAIRQRRMLEGGVKDGVAIQADQDKGLVQLQEFMNHGEVEAPKGKSPYTKYGKHWRLLAEYLGEQNIDFKAATADGLKARQFWKGYEDWLWKTRQSDSFSRPEQALGYFGNFVNRINKQIEERKETGMPESAELALMKARFYAADKIETNPGYQEGFKKSDEVSTKRLLSALEQLRQDFHRAVNPKTKQALARSRAVILFVINTSKRRGGIGATEVTEEGLTKGELTEQDGEYIYTRKEDNVKLKLAKATWDAIHDYWKTIGYTPKKDNDSVFVKPVTIQGKTTFVPIQANSIAAYLKSAGITGNTDFKGLHAVRRTSANKVAEANASETLEHYNKGEDRSLKHYVAISNAPLIEAWERDGLLKPLNEGVTKSKPEAGTTTKAFSEAQKKPTDVVVDALDALAVPKEATEEAKKLTPAEAKAQAGSIGAGMRKALKQNEQSGSTVLLSLAVNHVARWLGILPKNPVALNMGVSIARPFTPFGDPEKAADMYTEAFGMERIWGLRRLASSKFAQKDTFYFRALARWLNEYNVSRGKQQMYEALFHYVDEIFKVNPKTGEANIVGAYDPINQSRHLSDAFTALQYDPNSYTLTKEQREVFDMIITHLREMQQMRKDYGINKVEDEWGEPIPYFGRFVIEFPVKKGVERAHTVYGGFLSKTTGEKPRYFKTEREGWQRGYKYETSLSKIMGRIVGESFRAVAGKRFANDPHLRGISEKDARAHIKKMNPGYTASSVEATLERWKINARAPIAALRGNIYSEKDAVALNNLLDRMRLSKTLGLIADANAFTKVLQFTYDVGVGMLQLQPMAVRNPVKWVKAQMAGLAAMFDPNFMRSYYINNWNIVEALSEKGHTFANLGEIASGDSTTPLLQMWSGLQSRMERIPGLKPMAPLLTPLHYATVIPTKAFMRFFHGALDVATIEMWKGIAPKLRPDQEMAGVRMLESMLGMSRTETTMVTAKRALYERALLMASTYYRSAGDTLSLAFYDWSAPGWEAKKALLSYAGGLSIFYLLMAKFVFDMDDEDIIERFDPNNSKFLMWRVPNPDGTSYVNIGPGGIYRSLFRLAWSVGQMGKDRELERLAESGVSDNIQMRWYRSHASPLASMGISWFTGDDYLGRKMTIGRSFAGILPLPAQAAFFREKEEGPIQAPEMIASFTGQLAFPERETRGEVMRRKMREMEQNPPEPGMSKGRSYALAQQFYNETKQPTTLEQDARLRKNVAKMQTARQERMTKLISQQARTILEKHNLKVGPWTRLISVNGIDVPLSRDEGKLYEMLLRDEYNKMAVRMAESDAFKRADTQAKKEAIWSNWKAAANKVAKNQMTRYLFQRESMGAVR